jgi:hypothetical protein
MATLAHGISARGVNQSKTTARRINTIFHGGK